MLYCEFIENTGCKDNEHNYKVYKDLEVLYMNNDNISKAEIYEYGKKLVDNSKSESELKVEAEVKAEIAQCEERIQYNKNEIAYRERMVQLWTEDNDKDMVKSEKSYIAYLKREIKSVRARINALKWVLR